MNNHFHTQILEDHIRDVRDETLKDRMYEEKCDCGVAHCRRTGHNRDDAMAPVTALNLIIEIH